MQSRKKAAPLFVLSFVFLLPVIIRMTSLVEASGVRAVDLATIAAASFAAGVLCALGIARWREA
jgi:hypothetical protein